MRRLSPWLATLFVALAMSAPAPARAETFRPLVSVGDGRFELFGTSFCYLGTQPSTGCDVALPERLSVVTLPPPDSVKRVKFLGITFCSELSPTGPACDVVWVPPLAANAWRDMPEIRLAEAQPFVVLR